MGIGPDFLLVGFIALPRARHMQILLNHTELHWVAGCSRLQTRRHDVRMSLCSQSEVPGRLLSQFLTL